MVSLEILFRLYLVCGYTLVLVVGCIDFQFHNAFRDSVTYLAFSQQGIYLCTLDNPMICHIAWN